MTAPDARVKVLFVDDDPLVLRSVSRAVGDSVAVWTATCAEEALALLQGQEIDVVVSDLDLPDINGIALLGMIRRAHPGAVRMMLTGAPSLERAIAAINEGELHRFFVKPLDLDAFARAVQALGERITQSRREAAKDAERTRRFEFFAWVDAGGRAPHVTRDDAGELVLDETLLESSLEALGADDVLALLSGD